MRVSETFYSTLWTEFLTNPHGAWLLDFYRRRRQTAGNDFSTSSPAELLALLADSNRDLSLPKSEQEWVLSLGSDSLREPLTHTRGKRNKYRLLQKWCEENPEQVSGKDLDRLRSLVLTAAVQKEAWDFFYNIGYQKPKEEEEAQNMEAGVEKHVSETVADRTFSKARKQPRRKDNAFAMLDEWCEGTSHTLRADCGLTDETRKDWNRMYTILQRQKEPTDVILPVQIDPITGIGLYLIGIDQYWHEEVREQLESLRGAQGKPCNCIFVCLAPIDFTDSTDEWMNEPNWKGMLRQGSSLTYAPRGDAICCVTLEDGEQQFAALLQNEPAAYSFFRDNNGTAPEGTPERLKTYFSQEEEFSFNQLVEEGKAALERS